MKLQITLKLTSPKIVYNPFNNYLTVYFDNRNKVDLPFVLVTNLISEEESFEEKDKVDKS